MAGLDDIKPTGPPSSEPDPKTKQEQEAYETERRRAELDSYKQDTDERKAFAKKIFTLICVWLAGVFLLLLGQGFLLIKLSDNVLITAITGTTLNVIGIFLVVTNYLFPKR